uniref:Protein krueppel n=1 Tax=Anopheles coluzzii TaxID=1518534 RepID=A0A6E8VG07_ANOCL
MFPYKQTQPSETVAPQLHPELHTICRTCLQQSNDTRSIFDLDQTTQLTYSEKVMQCVDVEIYPHDSLPNRICRQCVDDLDVACRFRANCTSSSVVLQTYLSYNGLEEKQLDMMLQPTLAQSVHSDPDDGDEIAIHLDSGVMYTYKPPSGLDVKLVHHSAEDVIFNSGNMKMESLNGNANVPVEEPVNSVAATMAMVEPMHHSSLDGNITLAMESAEATNNDHIEYMFEVVNEPETDDSMLEPAVDVMHVQNTATADRTLRKTTNSMTPDSTNTHSNGKQYSFANRTNAASVKTLQTIRKSHTPNETKPTIEAVTTQPAADGSGVETVIRVKRNLSAPKPSLVCKLCNVTYKHKHALETHMRRHRGDRPHKCDYCEKSFVVPFELQRHMRIHTGQKPYKCQYCERAYSDFGSKTKHERTHTGERPYACHYCDKTFSYSHVLNSHLLVHTGVKKYCCSICGKRFTKSHHLKTHYNTHQITNTDVGTVQGSEIEMPNNSNSKQQSTDVIYTEQLQDELIASKDEQQSSGNGGVLVDSYHHGTGPGLIAATEWTTMVHNNGGGGGGGSATSAAITTEELENVSIVNFADYIIKSDSLDDLLVVQDSGDDELVELVGQPIMHR